MRNSAGSKNISLFKVAVLLSISLYFRNLYLTVMIAVYLIINNRKEFIIYLFLVVAIYIIERYRCDIIPIGIVDYKKYNYYIVDKFFYKVRFNSSETFRSGDVILFSGGSSLNDNESQFSKNIIFVHNKGSLLFSFFPRSFISNKISLLDESILAIVNKTVYNLNSYDDLKFNMGYGLISYYFLNSIRKKDPRICIVAIVIYSLLFVFEIRFILLIIDVLCDLKDKDSTYRMTFKLLAICIINSRILTNYSVLLPLLFSLYRTIDLPIGFNTYMFMIESLLFGEADILGIFLFKHLISLKIVIFLFSLLVLFFPFLSDLFLYFSKGVSFLYGLEIPVRGQISVLSFIIFILCFRMIRNRYRDIYTFVLCIILILSPLNDPFDHITYIDVSQGDSIMIKTGLKRSCILIDTGSEFNYYKLRSRLFKEGIYTIDHLIITHDDSDHNGNIENLYSDFKVKDLVMEGKDIQWHDLYLKYCYLGEYDNDNDNSLVYYMYTDGYGFLFTGDISKNVEGTYIRKYGDLNVDFLKVSHHGSVTASSRYFISELLPDYAIISTSGQYNHPHPDVIKVLNEYLVKTFITRQCGSVSVYLTSLIDLIKTDNGEFVIIK